MKTAVFTCLALLACSAVSAATPAQIDLAKRRCEDRDDRVIVQAVSQVDQADKILPNIPPEEARYLKAESEALIRFRRSGGALTNAARDQQMFNALQARPMYPVYQLREELARVRTSLNHILALDGVRSYPDNAEAEKLARAASAVSNVTNFKSAVAEFSESTQRAPVDDERQLAALNVYALLFPIEFGEYINCKLAKVMLQK